MKNVGAECMRQGTGTDTQPERLEAQASVAAAQAQRATIWLPFQASQGFFRSAFPDFTNPDCQVPVAAAECIRRRC